MKKASFVFIILFFNLLSLFSISLKQIEPDRIYFYSKEKDVEVYCNNSLVDPIIKNGMIEIDNLWPETEYEITFINTDGQKTKFDCITDSWKGLYRWTNNSDDTNKGRCKELTFYVEKAESLNFIEGIFYNIYEVGEGFDKKTFRIFPLVDLKDVKEYPVFKFNGDNEISRTYRRNALSFNTTSFKPSSFYCSSIEITPSKYLIDVKTKTFAFKVTTTTTYKFVINQETGKKELWFILDGDKMAKMGMFKNPIAREGTGKNVFILEAI